MSSSDYIYFNTKLRALMSFFLKEEDFAALINTESLSSLISQLQNFRFYSALENLEISSSAHKTAKAAENILWTSFQNNIDNLKKYIPNPKVKSVIRQLTKRLEIDNLKKIISAVCYQKTSNINPDVYIGALDPQELLTASSIDNLLLKLEKTEYYSVLLPALDLFKKTKNNFHFSIVLDKYYFDLLFHIVSNLDTMNRGRLESVFLFMAERFNLENLIRFQKYYQMSLKEIIPFLYPKGALYPYAQMQNSFVWEDYIAKNPVFQVLRDRQEEKNAFKKLIVFEQMLDAMFSEKIRSFLLGNPFSPGIFLSYYFLYYLEIKKIIFLINGKIYKLSAERLMRIV